MECVTLLEILPEKPNRYLWHTRESRVVGGTRPTATGVHCTEEGKPGATTQKLEGA